MSFLETGTYYGGGVLSAARCRFKKIHSVEAVREYYDGCCQRFAPQIQDGSVTLHYGGSETVLPAILPTFAGPICFWLDAHLQRVAPGFPAKHCPLTEEIGAICEHRSPEADDAIFIDDVRLLVTRKAWQGHDVAFEQCMGQLVTHYRNHFSCFIDGYVENDIFCVVPQKYAAAFFAVHRRVRGLRPPLGHTQIAAAAVV